MSPSFPTGARLSEAEWEAVTGLCREHDLWLLYWTLMEGIVFDGAEIVAPAGFEGMAERTITIGALTCEWRMIGWRIGWLAGPDRIAEDLGKVHIYNGLVAGGIAQAGALAALGTPEDELRACVEEWERRRDLVMEQLDGFPAVRADGGWSTVRHRRHGHRSRRRLEPAARRAGGRHADEGLGRRGGRSAPADRLLDRAARATRAARRADARRARLSLAGYAALAASSAGERAAVAYAATSNSRVRCRNGHVKVGQRAELWPLRSM